MFFTLCVGAAFMMRKTPVWERMLIVVSAPPIAVLANVFRITLTAVLFEMAHQWPSVVSKQFADKVFHDFAGLLIDAGGFVDFIGRDGPDFQVNGATCNRPERRGAGDFARVNGHGNESGRGKTREILEKGRQNQADPGLSSGRRRDLRVIKSEKYESKKNQYRSNRVCLNYLTLDLQYGQA